MHGAVAVNSLLLALALMVVDARAPDVWVYVVNPPIRVPYCGAPGWVFHIGPDTFSSAVVEVFHEDGMVDIMPLTPALFCDGFEDQT